MEILDNGYEDMDCMVDSDNTCVEDYHDPAENNMMLSKHVDTEYRSKPDEEFSTVNPLWSDFRFDNVNTLEVLMMINPAYDPPHFTSPARLLSDDAHEKLEGPSLKLGNDDQSESYVNDDEDPTNQTDDQSESYVNDDEDPADQTDDQSESYVNDDEDPTNQTDDQSESYVNDDEDPADQTDDQSESYVNDDEDPANQTDDQSESYVNDDEDPTNQMDDHSESYVNDNEDPANRTDDQSAYVNDDEDTANQTDDRYGLR